MKRCVIVVGMLAMMMDGASAYDGFSPLSGPNTAIPSPVCDVINFGFCPQPPSPPLPAPDPNAVAPTRVALPPAPIRHRVAHGHRKQMRARVD